VDLSDASGLLTHLFLGDPRTLPCSGGTSRDPGNRQLLDWNGDGQVDMTDAIGQLVHLFRGGPEHALGPISRCVPIEGCPELCGR
jgi:hypothetical protein